MIPEFPEFKKLSIEDAPAVDAITTIYPTYSDYNFTSLWGWDTQDEVGLSSLNGNLVIRFTDYETGKPFLSFLGKQMVDETAEALLTHSENHGMGNTLRLIPEVVADVLTTDSLVCTADEANHDYVYITSKVAALEGNKYSSKRKLRNRFIRENQKHEFRVCDLSDPEVQKQVRGITTAWGARRNIDEDAQSIEHEIEAIENVFTLAESRPIFAGMVFVNGVPTAFTIEEIVNGSISIGHFWKAVGGFPGEYEFLASRTAEYLVQEGVTYWNWEQDLGIPSLRASKGSYRPSKYLKKFIVSRRKPTRTKLMLLLSKLMTK
tara:strand:- start:132643 stop:133602 length:960 start_codon:yes stop_codon:yes gene_type:complete